MRLQAKGGPQVDLTGTVDSGATQTALPIKAAELLGIGSTDLRKADPVIVANELEVPSWTTAVPIRGQVHSQSSPDGPFEPWGPIIEFNPIFLEDGSPLWGQADFFATFEVTFWRNANPAAFGLSY
jgi:hypothetical protein